MIQPICISVHIPDELHGHILPTLEFCDPRIQQSEHGLHSQYLPAVRLYPTQSIRLIHFFPQEFLPFFPLSPTFNPLDGQSWSSLASQIQIQLVQQTWVESPNVTLWLREFFWMAYVGAFPTFPYGDCLAWDPRISMEGDFISYWIADSKIQEMTPDILQTTRGLIWEEFQNLAASLLPIVSQGFH